MDAGTWRVTEFLNQLDLRGQTWCIVEVRSSGGFSVSPSDSVFFYSVLQGRLRLASGGDDTIELRPGEAVMVLSGMAHAIRSEANSSTQTLKFLNGEQAVDTPPTFTVGSDGPVAARVICGKLKVSSPSILRRTALPPVLTEPAHRIASGAGRAHAMQAASEGAGSAALLTRMAAFYLGKTLRDHPQFPVLFRLSASGDPIAQALELVGADVSTDWSVERLAHEVGMGRSSFSARFAAEVGRTPMDVITERRMQLAATLLRQGHLKIAEVCLRSGYTSESAFCRRFTRYFGVTPAQMRGRMIKRQDSPESTISSNIF